VVTLVLPRLVSFEGAGRRSVSVAERNVAALRSAYWIVLVSGALEPVFYLLSIGVGVGELVSDIALPGGRVVSYASFVAPAMLAAAAMSGALAETTFNFFFKIKYARLYDAVLATPVRPFEIALGELGWAMARGALYSAAFLVVMVAMGLAGGWLALAAFPAVVLVGFAFGALGMALATFMRSWQDFDLMYSVQFALFLFSGTFVPIESYPPAARWLVELSPLYQSVSLVRGISAGSLGWAQVGNVVYLLLATVLGLVVAARRMGRLLLK
jgi:lipooligosaccharide transport system permease protein